MDNNLPQPQTQPQPQGPMQATGPQPQVVTQAATGQTSKGRSSNKLVIVLLLGVAIILLVVGGAYFYLQSQQAKNTQTTSNYNAPVTNKAPQVSLEEDLNSIDIATNEADLAPVDNDIQGL